MKKHLRNWLGLFCFALLACLWGAAPLQAAGNTVLVLPFQVTAGPEMPNAARDVPQIIGTEMQQRGLAGDKGIHLRVVTHRAAAKIGGNRIGGEGVYRNAALAQLPGQKAGQHGTAPSAA